MSFRYNFCRVLHRGFMPCNTWQYASDCDRKCMDVFFLLCKLLPQHEKSHQFNFEKGENRDEANCNTGNGLLTKLQYFILVCKFCPAFSPFDESKAAFDFGQPEQPEVCEDLCCSDGAGKSEERAIPYFILAISRNKKPLISYFPYATCVSTRQE